MKDCYRDNQFHIEIPDYVVYVLDKLKSSGHEAYAVGGCIRDSLMGRTPKDWDVCTSALPAETKSVFKEERIIETGLKHGTITVLSMGYPVEITTYRIDGAYEDGRHPEQVFFTRSLEEDLARRDFTINAMAYHPEPGLVDLFHGKEHLENRWLCCVGDPKKRFSEDGLRIMRGLRLSAELGFAIEERTLEAMIQCQTGLKGVSKERIQIELSKLLMGEHVDHLLEKQGDFLKTILEGFQAATVQHLPENLPIRLAQVFPKETERYLKALKYDNQTIETAALLSQLIQEGAPPTDSIGMKRFLHQYGESIARIHYQRWEKDRELEDYLAKKPCFHRRHLAVTGRDLMTLTDISMLRKSSPEIGRILSLLLNLVIEEQVANEKEALLQAAKEVLKHE